MKFSEYRESRNTLEFDRKFSLLCEGIVRSGHSFDSWWSSEGLPVILESNRFDDEEELIVELLGGIGRTMGNMAGRAWGGIKNLGQGTQQGWQQGQQAVGQGQEQPMDIPPENFQDPNAQADAAQQAPAMSPEKQQRLDSFQRGIDQSTDQIKQRFSGAMRDFLHTVQDDAKQQNNAHMWQIAKNFNQKVMQAAQPAIDSFKQTGRYSSRQQGGYQDQFAQAQGAMQQNQQAALKQQLQQKHGAQVAGGPQNLQPQGRHPSLAAANLAQQQGVGNMRPGMTVR